MTGPYDPPPFPSPSFPQGNWDPVSLDPPPIILWYKIHMVALVVLHLLIVGVGFFMGIMADEIAQDASEAMGIRLFGLIYVLWGFVLAIVYGATLFLPTRQWAWIYNTVAVCLSILSGCCILFPIIILIFWVREDVRRWYGMQ